ncbi:hypothetical protein V8E53_007369 [Lactarius tabidus]
MEKILPPTVRLNNHYQDINGVNQSWAIVYVEVDRGATVQKRWSVTVKIHGEEMGSCSAGRKSEAREAAAQQACIRLGIP